MTADVSINPDYPKRLVYEINIPSDQWDPNGAVDAGEDVWARLHCASTIYINGIPFHTEALAVTVDETGTQVAHEDWQEDFEDYCAAAGTDGHLETVTINGREYAVFLSPYCN